MQRCSAGETFLATSEHRKYTILSKIMHKPKPETVFESLGYGRVLRTSLWKLDTAATPVDSCVIFGRSHTTRIRPSYHLKISKMAPRDARRYKATILGHEIISIILNDSPIKRGKTRALFKSYCWGFYCTEVKPYLVVLKLGRYRPN